jgi:peptidyl-prolyl cis-trans isomerase D
VQHQPARVQPLAEVKDQVRQRVVVEQAAALARKDGAAALAAAKAKPADALPDTVTISRSQLQGLPRQVVDAALRADPTALPAIQGVEVPQWGYAVVKVQRVLPHEAAPGGDAPLVSQYGQAWGAAEAEAYLEALKKRYGASYKESAVAAAVAASGATP